MNTVPNYYHFLIKKECIFHLWPIPLQYEEWLGPEACRLRLKAHLINRSQPALLQHTLCYRRSLSLSLSNSLLFRYIRSPPFLPLLSSTEKTRTKWWDFFQLIQLFIFSYFSSAISKGSLCFTYPFSFVLSYIWEAGISCFCKVTIVVRSVFRSRRHEL